MTCGVLVSFCQHSDGFVCAEDKGHEGPHTMVVAGFDGDGPEDEKYWEKIPYDQTITVTWTDRKPQDEAQYMPH